MKNIGKLAVLGAVLAASSSFAFADTLTLGSFATGQTPATFGDSASQTAMSWPGYTSFVSPPADPQPSKAPDTTGGSGTTFMLLPVTPTWTAALPNSTWIGIATTAGPTGTVNVPYGYYTFSTTFGAAGGTYNGSITVSADDTTEVYLNGSKIISFGNLGGDGHCADNKPNCSVTDTLSLSGISLGTTNTLQFVVEQAGNQAPGTDPSGVDFDATLTSAGVPEPSSLMLLGTGLMSAAGMLLRRRRQTV